MGIKCTCEGNRKRFDVRLKALTMLDAHSIRIMKRTSECRINERVWKRHNAYGRSSKRNTVEQHQVVSLRSQIMGV
jgi:hypothetical protein